MYSHREVTGLEEEARRRKEEKEQEDAIFKTQTTIRLCVAQSKARNFLKRLKHL